MAIAITAVAIIIVAIITLRITGIPTMDILITNVSIQAAVSFPAAGFSAVSKWKRD
jgi:hypothetical protein